jgi:D-serine deaminase-like pyridoxal phosphate-dependent protein
MSRSLVPDPLGRDQIPTPALLLDLDRFERNIAAMAAHVRAAGKQIRPHSKTHKCPEIAKRQIAAGAVGVACAKLGEAEVMAAAGIRGLLVTTEIVGEEKLGRFARLLERGADVMVVVDHPDNLADLSALAARVGRVLDVLVDVDVGGNRTGCRDVKSAVTLAGRVADARSLRFRGLQGYAGHCAHVAGWAARRDASKRALQPLMEARAEIEGRGQPVEIVTGGSTGTHDIDFDLGMTELQSGSYCVMDLEYLRIGGRRGDRLTEFEMALTVLTTVVSVPSADLAIVDGGLKAFSTDRPFPPEPVERPGVEYGFAGDEHGRLFLKDPARGVRLSERVELFPPHCDPTINLYDRIYAMRGDRVEAIWDVAARGRSQ